MKTKVILLCLVLMMAVTAVGQMTAVTLTFTARYNSTSAYIRLDSIKVTNISRGMDTVLYFPDTVLVLEYSVGIPKNNKQDEGFRVLKNFLNPVLNKTMVTIFVPGKDNVEFSVTDARGRSLLKTARQLNRGYHSFYFTPGEAGLLFFTATWEGTSSTIKILSGVVGKSGYNLAYAGFKGAGYNLKSDDSALGFVFNPGDSLLFTGYATTPAGIAASDVLGDTPQGNQTYMFEIIEGVPCHDIPAVRYAGKVYTTVQIGGQCWFKKSLNIGSRIDGNLDQTDNGIIEKYCANDDENNCNTYGGLYQWNETMMYSIAEGGQGLCPGGWHIPTDAEATILVDFLGGGNIAGGNMKETGLLHWASPNSGATNSSGFTALPNGCRYYTGYFIGLTQSSGFQTSSQYDPANAWYRGLAFDNTIVSRSNGTKNYGFTVRCLKN